MPSRDHRVLVLINTVEDSAGGVLRAAVNLAEAMAGAGTAVTFSAPVAPNQLHRTVDLMTSRVDRQLFAASRPAARFGGSVRQLAWLWRHARSFDEVQTHSIFSLSAVYAIVICAMRGVPVFLWPHGSIDPFDLRKHARIKSMLGPLVVRRLLDRCGALFFTTARESSIAVTYGSRTPHEVVALPVAPLAVDRSDGNTWRERHGVPADVPVVLFLGRINYKKRLPLLVEAVSLLESAAHLVVVGDGETDERQRVADAAARFDVADRLHITGWLEGADRAEAFAAADVFALLSDAENFGLSVIEALSAGVPAVISDQLDLAEQLERAGAAVRVERDAVAASRAMDALLADPAAAAEMGARGRGLVAQEFSPSAVAARLREATDRRAVSSRSRKGRA